MKCLSLGYNKYETFVDNNPKPAPATTSLNQCLLLYILSIPVAVANAYPEYPIQGLESLYSWFKNSAEANAFAV